MNALRDRRVSGPLLLLLMPLLGACRQERLVRDDTVPPFVFRSLNLRQQDQKGQPAWELTSPEARYDLQRRVTVAIKALKADYAEDEGRRQAPAGREDRPREGRPFKQVDSQGTCGLHKGKDKRGRRDNNRGLRQRSDNAGYSKGDNPAGEEAKEGDSRRPQRRTYFVL